MQLSRAQPEGSQDNLNIKFREETATALLQAVLTRPFRELTFPLFGAPDRYEPCNNVNVIGDPSEAPLPDSLLPPRTDIAGAFERGFHRAMARVGQLPLGWAHYRPMGQIDLSETERAGLLRTFEKHKALRGRHVLVFTITPNNEIEIRGYRYDGTELQGYKPYIAQPG
ncbi:hypothetical protein [Deinococcus pimensis]|uniref:hypothetical protein n=1 Tax=Deinococcus pimensis TaxID=309888 RepID=UPI0004870410|nr:hypothetical protein [Deinococcus pimensis]